MNKFEKAKQEIAKAISKSKVRTDPAHSLNTLKWLLHLNPGADEILQLAALAHDIERGTPDPLDRGEFKSYEDYKLAHATRAGQLAAGIALKAGHSEQEAQHLAETIKYAETGNGNEDSKQIMDADSVSYFDVHIEEYLRTKGKEVTQNKMQFMYNRASGEAKAIIDKILETKPSFRELLQNQIDLKNK